MKSTTKSSAKKNGQSSRSSSSSKKSSASQTSGDSSSSEGLMELLEAEMKDIYWAEKALVKALPKMIKKATSEELISAIQDHLAVTEGQVSRLEQAFESIGVKVQAKKCEAMAGLLKEAEELMEDNEEGPVRDAAIIAAGQKVEHYEIATYGTLRTFAEMLRLDEAMALFQETLDEEKEADETLTACAMTINLEAIEAGQEDEAEA